MRTKTVLSIPVLVLALSALPASAVGVTWWVDDDACPGPGDGSQGNPFCLIQDAYDAAGDADEVRVMPGTYTECVAAADLVSQKGVSLVADAFDPQDPEASAMLTTIDGTGLCSFPDATVNLGGVGSRLEGFHVTGGEASGVFGVGSVTITNNLIEGNSSTLGGGIYVYPGACVYGDTTTEVSNNIVRNNSVAFDAVAQYSGDGGGIYVFARADAGVGGCLQGSPTVTVDNNTIDSNSSDFLGGGMVFFSLSADTFTSVTGTISQNTITGNQAGVPGAGGTDGEGGGLWGTTYGYGTETLTVQNNTVSDNASTLSAGGISLRMDSLTEADHTILVDNNDVINNSAGGDGGGMQLWMIATDVMSTSGMTFQATDNTITGNNAVGDNGGGGGLLAISESIRSNVAAAEFTISGNAITGNQSDLAGGGVGLWVSADSENFNAGDNQVITGLAQIDFDHNLVAGNTAGSATTTGFGGGIFTYLQSFGGENSQTPSTATANVTFNTIAFNENDGGSGGIEIENNTGLDSNMTAEGLGVLLVDSSIVADNVNSVGGGYGIGGPPPGVQGFLQSTASTFNLQLDVNYSNVSGHTVDGNFQSDFPVLPAGTTSQEDALLNATTRRPMECSPTIDAANPFAAGVDASLEPAPNRGLPNQGHTGGTSLATVSLPDVNGDGVVDGIDVTRLAAAFGSSFGQGRYNASADMDGNDVIDGTDLAFVATMGYGDVCP